MIRTFQVQNVKCDGCAHTLKEKLSPLFGKISVDLSKEPREITVELENDDQIEVLAEHLKGLGYPLVDAPLSMVESGVAKAKSFVSCAVGRVTKGDGSET